jgi:alkylation response protein AidB-like acyl-CoA dehydrogenase
VDFTLTDEQQALRSTAAKWLARQPAGGGAERWQAIRELGWLDPDLDTVDLAVLAEETGTALFPLPWFATVGLAGPALRAAGRVPSRPATLAWAEPSGERNRGRITLGAYSGLRCRAERGGRLAGAKHLVPGPIDDAVVLAEGPDGPALYLVDLSGSPAAVRPQSTMDTNRPVAVLLLDGVTAEELVPAAETAATLRHTRRTALTLLAAEAVGIASRALETAVEYARQRTQFGRPIGAFQGVSHPLADCAAATELARSLVYRAAWCTDAATDVDAGTGADVDEAVLTATIAAREAALAACQTAVQTLGGTGFTWEHPLHRWYRRARAIASFDGATPGYRAELAAMLLDSPAG